MLIEGVYVSRVCVMCVRVSLFSVLSWRKLMEQLPIDGVCVSCVCACVFFVCVLCVCRCLCLCEITLKGLASGFVL